MRNSRKGCEWGIIGFGVGDKILGFFGFGDGMRKGISDFRVFFLFMIRLVIFVFLGWGFVC